MNFFSNIKSLMGSSVESYDPAGRYLAFVIKAVADHDGDFLPLLLGINKTTLWICSTEYSFQGGERLADLAIYKEGNNEPTFLIEIKVRDNKDNDHTRGQFADYQKWASGGKSRKVFIISPYGLPDTQIQAIRESGKLLHLVDLSKIQFNVSHSVLINIFSEYLMEEGYIMKKLDEEKISAFTHFLVGAFLPHRHGLGGDVKTSSERVADGPLIFADIVNNFQQFIVQTFPSSPKKPTVQYYFQQGIKASRILEKNDAPTKYVFKVEDPDDEDYYPPRKLKVGGKLHLSAYCPLEKNKGYLYFGIVIQIGKGKDNPVTYSSYVELAKGEESIAYKESGLDASSGFPILLSSLPDANKEFKKLTQGMITQLKKEKSELVTYVNKRLPSEWQN